MWDKNRLFGSKIATICRATIPQYGKALYHFNPFYSEFADCYNLADREITQAAALRPITPHGHAKAIGIYFALAAFASFLTEEMGRKNYT